MKRAHIVQIVAAVVGIFGCERKPTIESLDRFAKKVVPAFQEREREFNKDMSEENKRQGMTPFTANVIATLVSTDLKKTDSVEHPVVGEIVWTMTTERTMVENVTMTKDRYELRVFEKDGKWFPVEFKKENREGQVKRLNPKDAQQPSEDAQR